MPEPGLRWDYSNCFPNVMREKLKIEPFGPRRACKGKRRGWMQAKMTKELPSKFVHMVSAKE